MVFCFGALTLTQTVESMGQSPATVRKFEARVYKNERGEKLPYRLLKPINYDPGQAYPLILFLHGSGERGSNNTRQLKSLAPTLLLEDEVRWKYPCFVLVPQMPENAKWVYITWRNDQGGRAPKNPTTSLRLTLELLEGLKNELPIDQNRIYVTGLSMGGHGVWDILWRKPELFAAAVPISGCGDPSKAPLFADIPVWVFHGKQDRAVPIALDKIMVKAIRKAGGHPVYTEYPKVAHEAWIPAYRDPKLVKWLFAQRRDHR